MRKIILFGFLGFIIGTIIGVIINEINFNDRRKSTFSIVQVFKYSDSVNCCCKMESWAWHKEIRYKRMPCDSAIMNSIVITKR